MFARGIKDKVSALLESLIPDSLRQDPDVFRQAKRVAALSLAFLFWVIVFALVYVALGSLLCGLLTLGGAVLILVCLAALKRGRSPTFCGNVLCAAGLIPLTALAIADGGWGAAPLLWYTVLPVVSVLTSGVVWGGVWTLIALAVLSFFVAMDAAGIEFPRQLAPEDQVGFAFLVLGGLVVCQFIMACVRVGIEQRALQALHEANARLSKARRHLAALEEGYGLSPLAWTKLKREKAALEYALSLRVDDSDLDNDSDHSDPNDEGLDGCDHEAVDDESQPLSRTIT